MSTAVYSLTGARPLTLPPIRLVVMLLLWGIFFIKFSPLIALGLLAGMLAALHYVTGDGTVDRINMLVAGNMVFWLFSGFATGALTLKMLSNPSYFSNEGRIFVNYLALIIMSSCWVGVTTLRFAVRQMVLMAMLGLPLFIVWALKKPAILSVGHAHNFAGFTTSHTGAGTFFAEICVFLAIYGNRLRSRRYVLLGLSMLLPVLGSSSRESLVALAVVLAWYLRREISVKLVLTTTVLLTSMIVILPVVAPHTTERISELFDLGTFQQIGAQVTSATATNWEPGQDRDLSGEEFNILSRILYWSYALHQFRDSPFLGAGFGRFNDLYVHYAGIPGVFYFAVAGQNSPATLHAHNSYLQMLAETGLFGLSLLLAIWWQLWKRITRALREFRDIPEICGYFEALQGLIIFLMIGALFGHALGAPIDGIPVLALLGLGLSFYRTHRAAAWTTTEDGSELQPALPDPA